MVIRQVSGHADPAEHHLHHLQKWVWLLNFTTCWNTSQCDYPRIFCLKDGAGHQAPRRACCQCIPSLLSPGIRNLSSLSGLRLRAAFCICWPALKFFQSSLRKKKPSSCNKMSAEWSMASSACLSMVAGGKKKLITCVTLSPAEAQLGQTDAWHVNSLYHIEPWVWVLCERFFNSYNLK